MLVFSLNIRIIFFQRLRFTGMKNIYYLCMKYAICNSYVIISSPKIYSTEKTTCKQIIAAFIMLPSMKTSAFDDIF